MFGSCAPDKKRNKTALLGGWGQARQTNVNGGVPFPSDRSVEKAGGRGGIGSRTRGRVYPWSRVCGSESGRSVSKAYHPILIAPRLIGVIPDWSRRCSPFSNIPRLRRAGGAEFGKRAALRKSEMDAAITQSLSRLLSGVEEAHRESLTHIFPLIYEDIQRIAMRYMGHERASHTLTPTALVNEAFMRIQGRGISVQGQAHALALAAIAMRHILVEHARKRRLEKHGGGVEHVALCGDESSDHHQFEILELDEMITRLSEIDPRRARVVELRFFAQMTNEEIATVIGVARSTVAEDWSVARAWLGSQLLGGKPR